jgi:hypothetical protein
MKYDIALVDLCSWGWKHFAVLDSSVQRPTVSCKDSGQSIKSVCCEHCSYSAVLTFSMRVAISTAGRVRAYV